MEAYLRGWLIVCSALAAEVSAQGHESEGQYGMNITWDTFRIALPEKIDSGYDERCDIRSNNFMFNNTHALKCQLCERRFASSTAWLSFLWNLTKLLLAVLLPPKMNISPFYEWTTGDGPPSKTWEQCRAKDKVVEHELLHDGCPRWRYKPYFGRVYTCREVVGEPQSMWSGKCGDNWTLCDSCWDLSAAIQKELDSETATWYSYSEDGSEQLFYDPEDVYQIESLDKIMPTSPNFDLAKARRFFELRLSEPASVLGFTLPWSRRAQIALFAAQFVQGSLELVKGFVIGPPSCFRFYTAPWFQLTFRTEVVMLRVLPLLRWIALEYQFLHFTGLIHYIVNGVNVVMLQRVSQFKTGSERLYSGGIQICQPLAMDAKRMPVTSSTLCFCVMVLLPAIWPFMPWCMTTVFVFWWPLIALETLANLTVRNLRCQLDCPVCQNIFSGTVHILLKMILLPCGAALAVDAFSESIFSESGSTYLCPFSEIVVLGWRPAGTVAGFIIFLILFSILVMSAGGFVMLYLPKLVTPDLFLRLWLWRDRLALQHYANTSYDEQVEAIQHYANTSYDEQVEAIKITKSSVNQPLDKLSRSRSRLSSRSGSSSYLSRRSSSSSRGSRRSLLRSSSSSSSSSRGND